jgi:hypothetical protein
LIFEQAIRGIDGCQCDVRVWKIHEIDLKVGQGKILAREACDIRGHVGNAIEVNGRVSQIDGETRLNEEDGCVWQRIRQQIVVALVDGKGGDWIVARVCDGCLE